MNAARLASSRGPCRADVRSRTELAGRVRQHILKAPPPLAVQAPRVPVGPGTGLALKLCLARGAALPGLSRLRQSLFFSPEPCPETGHRDLKPANVAIERETKGTAPRRGEVLASHGLRRGTIGTTSRSLPIPERRFAVRASPLSHTRSRRGHDLSVSRGSDQLEGRPQEIPTRQYQSSESAEDLERHE